MAFEDSVNVFEGLTYDTGWWPADSSIQVAFTISLNGAVKARLSGEGQLDEQDANVGVIGSPERGELSSDLDLGVIAYFQLVDFMGYSGVWEVNFDVMDTFGFNKQVSFTPFLLGAEKTLESKAAKITLFKKTFNVLFVIDVNLVLNVIGTLDLTLRGENLEVGGQTIQAEGQTIVLDTPEGCVMDVPAAYTATFDGIAHLGLEPALEVCAPIVGCTKLTDFSIPVEFGGQTSTRSFPVQNLRFANPTCAADNPHCPDGEDCSGEVEEPATGCATVPGSQAPECYACFLALLGLLLRRNQIL